MTKLVLALLSGLLLTGCVHPHKVYVPTAALRKVDFKSADCQEINDHLMTCNGVIVTFDYISVTPGENPVGKPVDVVK